MQIILQNGFLTFVRRYCGYDLGTTEIFNIINDYFFDTKELDIDLYKNRNEKKAYITEGIFLRPVDKERMAAGILDEHEKIILVQDVLKKERVVASVKLFRQMLIENEIPLYITYHAVNTINKSMSSRELCLMECNFYELLSNDFERFYEATVRFIEDDLTHAMNLFFKEFNREDPRYQKYRKDKDVDVFFKLYVEHQNLQIISMFANSSDWSMKGDIDNNVSLYLQRTYNLTSTKVNKFILPSLSNVKDYI